MPYLPYEAFSGLLETQGIKEQPSLRHLSSWKLTLENLHCLRSQAPCVLECFVVLELRADFLGTTECLRRQVDSSQPFELHIMCILQLDTLVVSGHGRGGGELI